MSTKLLDREAEYKVNVKKKEKRALLLKSL